MQQDTRDSIERAIKHSAEQVVGNPDTLKKQQLGQAVQSLTQALVLGEENRTTKAIKP